MEIINLKIDENIERIDDGVVVALGFFDGIHLAHMELINKVLEVGRKESLKTGLVTFHPHPAFILNKSDITTFLTPLEVKSDLLAQIDLDYLFIVHFDQKTAMLDHKSFVETYLLPLNVHTVVAGYDNRYGYGGKGTIETISADSNGMIKPIKIEEKSYKGQKIGSTLIRRLLENGDVSEVRELLGRCYSVDGFVTHGRGRGKTIGLPTANIAPKYPYKIPKSGVYVVKVHHESSELFGICNIGHNPTFNYNTNMTIEVNILDFAEEIYGDYLRIEFMERVRDEVRFAGIDELLEQITKDKKFARKIIAK
jgi:riboflavin kinase/FMN adenylyltransferase